VDKAQADPQIVESLFRNFHSFKGISGIVGLAPAEARGGPQKLDQWLR
jgi:chemotaxis protein histidine kinase CheA